MNCSRRSSSAGPIAKLLESRLSAHSFRKQMHTRPSSTPWIGGKSTVHDGEPGREVLVELEGGTSLEDTPGRDAEGGRDRTPGPSPRARVCPTVSNRWNVVERPKPTRSPMRVPVPDEDQGPDRGRRALDQTRRRAGRRSCPCKSRGVGAAARFGRGAGWRGRQTSAFTPFGTTVARSRHSDRRAPATPRRCPLPALSMRSYASLVEVPPRTNAFAGGPVVLAEIDDLADPGSIGRKQRRTGCT